MVAGACLRWDRPLTAKRGQRMRVSLSQKLGESGAISTFFPLGAVKITGARRKRHNKRKGVDGDVGVPAAPKISGSKHLPNALFHVNRHNPFRVGAGGVLCPRVGLRPTLRFGGEPRWGSWREAPVVLRQAQDRPVAGESVVRSKVGRSVPAAPRMRVDLRLKWDRPTDQASTFAKRR